MTDAPKHSPRWAQVAASALFIVTSLRVLVAALPVFGWGVDPRASDVPTIGLGVTATALLSCAALAILALVLLNHARQKRPVHTLALGLWVIGTVVAVIHGLRDAQSMRIGLDWSAALATALATWHLCEEPLVRRFLIAATLALIMPLALQAGYQVLVEQPRLIEFYEQNRTEIVKQNRWSDETQDQRKYEARLYQTEARGRFEFSNVFGSVMATLTMLAGALAFAAGRVSFKSPWMRYVFWGVALAGAGTLILTFSKGAIGATLIACAATLGAMWMAQRRIAPRWIGMLWLIMVLGVIAAVLVRGAAGAPETAEGERSLLFRYHYWQGATRAWSEAPVTGIGPGHFRDAYLIHKKSNQS